MTEPAIVANPDDITSAWLTEVLHHANIEGTVSSFTAESIGTGQVGENVRFTLSGVGDLPATLVGKFASPNPASRETGVNLLNYKREVHFYRELQSRVNIQTPKVLFADLKDENHDYVIIMEDLAPGEQGDQLGGCDLQQAELAMIQLAHLHGPVWGDESLIDGELISDRRDNPEATKALYDAVSEGFLNRYADRLTIEDKEMVRAVGDCFMAYSLGYSGDETLIHIDYRLDNMMFGGPHPLTVVDWQSPAMGCALNDTAYFTGTSLVPALRQESEEALVRLYFETLTEYDVDLRWEDCWRYYRHHAPAGLIMAVIASMIVGETERGNDMFMVMAKRSAQMCRDLDSISIIRSGQTTS